MIGGLTNRFTVTPATDIAGLAIVLAGDIVAMIGMTLNAENGRKPKLSAVYEVSFA